MAARALGKLWAAQRAEALDRLRRSAAPAVVAPPAPPPVPYGSFRIGELGADRCRFACTPHHVPADAHRFCGRPTKPGSLNPHGSWCATHLSVVRADARGAGR